MKALGVALTPGALVLALGYLGKALIDKRLSQDLDRHKKDLQEDLEGKKTELKLEADSEIEGLRSALTLERQRIAALEERASKELDRVHARTIETMDALFATMHEARQQARRAVPKGLHYPPDGEDARRKYYADRIAEAGTAFGAAYGVLHSHGYYLDDQLWGECNQALEAFSRGLFIFENGLHREFRNLLPAEGQDPWLDAPAVIDEGVSHLLKAHSLARQFVRGETTGGS